MTNLNPSPTKVNAINLLFRLDDKELRPSLSTRRQTAFADLYPEFLTLWEQLHADVAILSGEALDALQALDQKVEEAFQ